MHESADTTVCHVEAALESSCEALVTLELIQSRAKGDDAFGAPARLAIEQLRRAIAELRKATDDMTGALTYGFVLGEPSGRLGATH